MCLGLANLVRGELFDLPPEKADAITDIKWLGDGRFQLIGTVNGQEDSVIGVFNADLWDFEYSDTHEA